MSSPLATVFRHSMTLQETYLDLDGVEEGKADVEGFRCFAIIDYLSNSSCAVSHVLARFQHLSF